MFGRRTNEVEAATALMEKYARVEETISAEVENLQPAIAELIEAGREVQTSETSEALNEQPAVSVTKARKRLESARGAIDTAGRKLDGLRARLMTIVGEMPTTYSKLLPTLPAHNEGVKQTFAAEWAAACAAFAQVLGKRAAIEAAIGERMDLSDPQPAAVELDPSISRPHRCVAGLKAAIENAANRYAVGHAPEKEVSPYAVYTLLKEVRGLPAGTLVIPASFPEGRLAALDGGSWVARWKDPEAMKAANAARVAVREIEAAEQQRLNEEAAERSRKAAAERAEAAEKDAAWVNATYGGESAVRESISENQRGGGVVQSSYMAQFLSGE